ncbi:hypothetical protein SOPP22_11995 [Shewanella sp. OPT22]|nr:hypothetical protein SOPP22_11995 [Shewanella sp. OPT22]
MFAYPVFAENTLDCDKAWTTIDINRCMSKDLNVAEQKMDKYLSKSKERYSEDSVILKSIDEAQNKWLEYRNSHCGSVYDVWRDGTIRGAMSLGCKLELTHQRTKVIWAAYLTYMDSTKPILPEPKEYKPKSW